MNERGPIMEPCGTPDKAWHGAKRYPDNNSLGVNCEVGAKPKK